jgi:thiol:disulfide interchange protein DsbD
VDSADQAGAISHQVRKAIETAHPAKSTSTSAVPLASPLTDQPVEYSTDQLTDIPKVRPRPVHQVLEVSGFLKAVVFSLLAGFILNFTPCVLPVVSLKVLGFVQQAQESRHRVSLIGLSFSAGIVVVFLVLAALASFAGYGWGDLFQKQEFLIAMIALVFAMALSLFNIFQLPIPPLGASRNGVSTQQGYLESFYKGTLATLLATPCSGPLLGGALAWTFRQPPAQIFAVFTCLGVGMSFPYVVMSFYPAALRWLPRPGNWIIHFERFMGFALLATAVYLLTILPERARIWVVLLCLFLAIGLYIWGQMTSLSDSFRRRLVVRLLAVIIMVVGGWLSMEVFPPDDRDEEYAAAQSLRWQPYSNMKLLEGARENRWVVVDFTADWCPNCLLVERTALQDRKVLETFRKHNVLLLKADLTRENPPAKRLLQQMGSRSIPFLALFPPGKHFWQPFFLRDIYRAGDVLSVFKIAAASKNN